MDVQYYNVHCTYYSFEFNDKFKHMKNDSEQRRSIYYHIAIINDYSNLYFIIRSMGLTLKFK